MINLIARKKRYLRYLPAAIGLCFFSHCTLALPTVESRTGEPVVSRREGDSRFPRGSSNMSSSSPNRTSNVSASTEERVSQLTFSQIETLQREVSELRGLLETQEYEMKQLEKAQQARYADLELRLKQIQEQTPKSAAALKAQKAGAAASGPKPLSASTTAAKLPSTAPMTTPAKQISTVLVTSAVNTAKQTELVQEEAVQDLSIESVVNEQIPQQSDAETYKAAYALVRTKRYAEAVTAMNEYLNRFPVGTYAGEAQYWLGEVYMVQWQKNKTNTDLLDKAATAFSTLTIQMPKHAKTGDALMKLGLVELEKGNIESAQQYLLDVKARYPGTAAARIAETRLKQFPQ